ncbi:hypothetical protein AC249_AIPGENE2238 [Exaiptasia diaphana]|nr:hypothetical protein AC249_AIPGENE2238 [Exaiptasia diaphana]
MQKKPPSVHGSSVRTVKLKSPPFKVRISIIITFKKEIEPIEYVNSPLKTEQDLVLESTNLRFLYKRWVNELLSEIEEKELSGSGWKFFEFKNIKIEVSKAEIVSGSSYIDLPDFIKKKKAVVNLKNKDDECFKWCVTRAVFNKKVNPERIDKQLIEDSKKFNWNGVNFPADYEAIDIFEKNNDYSINVILYEGAGYDCHLFIKSLGLSDGKITAIANTEEKYISFSKTIKVGEKDGKSVRKEIRFIDSFKFMASSLQNLAGNLKKEDFKNLKMKFNDIDLLLRKGVFPYDYFDSEEKLEETKLPPIGAFYSNLSNSSISIEDYEHAQKVWRFYKIKNMREYHDLYLKTDVLQLADVFETFRDVCITYYELDPAWYYTTPGLAWSALLKKSRVKLDLLSDPNKHLMIEKGKRGGLSVITKRHAVANNKYMIEGYDENKESVFLKYLDANNLYGWPMIQGIPTSDFRWVPEKEFKNWRNYPCILEVDLEYPKELHKLHNEYPCAPEKIKLGLVNKLCATLNDNEKKPFAIKAERTLHRVTFNPSSASPGETLYVHLPKLSDNMVYVPGSVGLVFNLTLAMGQANNTLVNNIGRILVSRRKVLYGGEILEDTNRIDLYSTYHDLFLKKQERENMLREGISSANMRKLRTAAGDKVSSDAAEVALAGVYGTKYRIPIQHPIIDNHSVFYAKALDNNLTFEITLADKSIGVTSDNTKDYSYSLSNIELEYECINSSALAQEASTNYSVGKGFYYENVLLHKTFTIAKATESVINEHVNLPRRSMSGILMLFVDPYAAGARDSEKFVYPKITKVNVNVDGMPNKLYGKGMLPTDFWTAIVNRIGITDITQKDFYTNKFALWIDLRTYYDNNMHGGGLVLNSTKDGVKLEIKRTAGGSGNITCYMFEVADAVMELANASLKSMIY